MIYRDDDVTADLVAIVRGLSEEIGWMLGVLDPARIAQWQKSPAPALPDIDTTERAKGEHGDTVPTIVADGKRLALRASVVASERELCAALDSLRAQRERLSRTFDRWEGIG